MHPGTEGLHSHPGNYSEQNDPGRKDGMKFERGREKQNQISVTASSFKWKLSKMSLNSGAMLQTLNVAAVQTTYFAACWLCCSEIAAKDCEEVEEDEDDKTNMDDASRVLDEVTASLVLVASDIIESF